MNQQNNFQTQFRGRAAIYGFVCGVLFLFFSVSMNAQERDSQAQQVPDIQYWQGILDLGSAKLTLNIEIEGEENGDELSAAVTVVEQGNSRITADKVELADGKLTLDLSSVQASFEGKLDESGQLCAGTFSQHGMDLDLELKRVESFDDDSAQLVEYWKGAFEPEEGAELEVGLKVFRMGDDSLTAKFDSYSQGATDLKVEFKKEGDVYEMKLPAANLEYSGTLNESKTKLTGTIKQGRNQHALNFNRSEFDDIPQERSRPQTPKAPFPYESEEVVYENSKQAAELAGTLTIPSGNGPFPVAIMISGSGASDRNASYFDHKPFLVIADHLARQGIAVLRYDDRGRGESKGDHAGATSADFATDVEAGIEFLKNHPKIDGSQIGLIGHSEGGMIAPMVAAQRDDVHFIVLLAGPGVNGGTILKSQSTAMMRAAGEPEESLDANRKVHDAILLSLKGNSKATNEDIEAASEAFLNSFEDKATRKLMESSAEPLVAILRSRWVRYFVAHEPAETLAQVKCHVLAMNGEKDLQVLCDLNLDPIEKALKRGTPASFKVVRLPNTNHVFQETDGSGTPDDYGEIEETFSPKALKVVSDWLKSITK
jgi:pimeloyl-ACP methyl ester carboxylesterase